MSQALTSFAVADLPTPSNLVCAGVMVGKISRVASVQIGVFERRGREGFAENAEKKIPKNTKN